MTQGGLSVGMGRVDASQAFDLSDPMGRRAAEAARKEAEIRESLMSPPGSLGLPELLEARRIEHGITDGAFAQVPFNERVFIHQVHPWGTDTATPGGVILLTEKASHVEGRSSCYGIIVAAGLKALDALYSNGIELGHYVSFVLHAPCRIRVDAKLGQEYQVVSVHAQDIGGSMDLAREIREGKKRIRYSEVSGQHLIVNPAGESRKNDCHLYYGGEF